MSLLTMLVDTQQQTLVRDGIPPQSWQLRMVRLWHPDLYLTEEENQKNMMVRPFINLKILQFKFRRTSFIATCQLCKSICEPRALHICTPFLPNAGK